MIDKLFLLLRFQVVVNYAFAGLHTTRRRLGEAAADTTLAAGDKRANLYKIVCGVTAAISQNRSLGDVFFISFHSHLLALKCFSLLFPLD